MSPFAKLCIVFLVLTQNVSRAETPGFTLEDNQLTATEGSCTEIKCRINRHIDLTNAYWFWMKDANWNKDSNDFDATVVYSTSNKSRSVSPDFAGRVTYTGILSWERQYSSSAKCSIMICKLKKTDSGKYSVRYVKNLSNLKWKTLTEVTLTVKENPCPITFEKPLPFEESQKVTLTCSTLSSCPLNPHITSSVKSYLPALPDPQRKAPQKSTTVSFDASWQNDGETFSCQTQYNRDPYLVQNISLTVIYAPRDIQATMSHTDIREKQPVTLKCSGRGSPAPTFTWFRNNQSEIKGPEWKISSIRDSQSGNYYCEAVNEHGTKYSNILIVDVKYAPEVVVNITSPNINITEGDKITFKCEVKRSNPPPQPNDFYWHTNGNTISGKSFSIESIRPEQSGSYSCRAENTVGIGTSLLHEISVHHRPRNTRISTQGDQKEVKVGSSFTFHCNTEAYPQPQRYSWYRYSQHTQTRSDWKPGFENRATLWNVQRADEACYTCNATNYIGTGNNSNPLCIRVRYAPTKPVLSVDPGDDEVVEGWLVTFSCSVESYPMSTLTLKKASPTDPRSVEENFFIEPSNSLHHIFTVSSTHTGFYTCEANNGEGSVRGAQRKLVVKYIPKNVEVEAQPGLVVKENTKLTLICKATSYPEVTSVFWTKVTDGKKEIISHQPQISLSGLPSDSGQYSCSAINEIGIGNSTQAEVEVKYAPKVTNVKKGAEWQHSNGKRYVTLSCSSQSNPPISEFTWYRRTKEEERTIKVSGKQNYTVDSDHPGFYHCVAKNELDEKMSDPVQLFVDRGIMKYVLIALILLLVIILLIFVYRHRRKKSIQRGATSTSPCFGFLGGSNRPRRRNLMNEPVMAEPFRSRDDLLPDQRCRPNAQQSHPPPDSTPVSNINTVYSTVILPAGKQGPSAQKPIKHQGGQTEGESLNYASLDFGKKPKKKKAKGDESTAVYAVVSKQKPPKEKQQEILADYENVSAVNGVKSPNPMDYDTDTSEEEVEINYSQVSFKAKPGHQRAGGPSNSDTSSETSSDSSTSDEDERTQYSQVKV